MDLGLLFEHVLGEVRLREPGADDEHVDAVFCEFGADRFAEPGHGELAGGVERAAGERAFADDGRDVHNRRRVAFFEHGQERSGRFDEAEEVGLEDGAEDLRVGIHEVAGGPDASVVDEYIEAAEVLLSRGKHRGAIFGLRDVRAHGREDAAGGLHFGGEFGEQLRRPGGGQNAATLPSREYAERPPDALRGTRHENPQAFQLPTCHEPTPRIARHKWRAICTDVLPTVWAGCDAVG